MDFLKRYRYWLAASSGIILFCSFPSVNLFPLAWVAIVPLLIALEPVENRKSAFLVGYVAGFLFFAGLLIAIVLLYPYANIFATLLGYILLVGYTALYFAVFAVLVHQLPWQSGILFPLGVAAIWVSLEWVRSWLLTGFPWGNIGYSQWKYLPGIQIASLTGVYGISFVIVFFNAGIATLIRNRNEWRKELVAIIVPCLLAMICLIYGYATIARSENTPQKSMKVAIIPGNIPQIEKWKSENFPKIFARYINLTRKAAAHNPDVIVWPETTVRGQVLSGEWVNYHNHFKKVLREIGGIPMLIGATDPDAFGDLYNRVISVSSEGEVLGKYAKMHLVPFGEYVPLADFLPNFVQFKPFERGKTVNLLPITYVGTMQTNKEQMEVGTSICFESAFPSHFRQFVKKGADAMGILTNDAWFVGTAFPELHLAMAPLRAVENRIAVLRCANGGYSCVVDSFGQITTPFVTPQTDKEFLIADVALSEGKQTFYTRYGDWLPIFCLVLSILCIAYRVVIRYTKPKITDN
ncbi:MAG: apolipoprotein N-acyltransferase [Candidatus Poribacteria bacterium]|nr:apolipoprotein N-acyltransferase [Candidatus Poribacteria bacterium]